MASSWIKTVTQPWIVDSMETKCPTARLESGSHYNLPDGENIAIVLNNDINFYKITHPGSIVALSVARGVVFVSCLMFV